MSTVEFIGSTQATSGIPDGRSVVENLGMGQSSEVREDSLNVSRVTKNDHDHGVRYVWTLSLWELMTEIWGI